MKSYYQYKNNGYTLPKPIYAKMVKTVRAYEFYKGVVNSVDNKSEIDITEEDISSKALAENYIASIDRALKAYVISDLREPVFRHVAYSEDYIYLEEKYHRSRSVMKRWTQRFVYGVAIELGENFRK